MSTRTAQKPGFEPRYEEEPGFHLYEDAQEFTNGFTPGNLQETEVHAFLDRVYDAVGPEWFEAFIAGEYGAGDEQFYAEMPEDDEVFRAQVKATMWNTMVDSPYFSVEPDGDAAVHAHMAAEGLDVDYEKTIQNMVEDEIIEQEFGSDIERSSAEKYTKAGVAMGALVGLAGCAGAGLGMDDSVQDTPNPEEVNEDGDAFSPALEREIGTNDTVPNERAGEVYELLEGNLSEVEKEFLRYVADNPHNVWPQIQEEGVYKDGDVTAAELKNMSDGDEDGLILGNEKKIGTDPDSPDTDMDGLPDGPEWAEGAVVEGVHNPLQGSDPLHMNVYIMLLPIDGNLSSDYYGIDSEEAVNVLERRYKEAAVTNPDGTEGIEADINFWKEDLERYRDRSIGFQGDAVAHPYTATRFFVQIQNLDKDYAGYVGGTRNVFVDAKSEFKLNTTDHELLHLMVSYDEDHWNNRGHPGYWGEPHPPFQITNDVLVREEIGKEGITLQTDWEEINWRMPGNKYS